VLLVSYFASALDDVFRAAVPLLLLLLNRGKAPALLHEELRVTVEELVALQAEPEAVGELFRSKKDISFQDMQSIVRAFKDYVGVEISRDEHTDNIIIAQACRHVIVHAGGEADKRLVRQVAQANRRTVKTGIRAGQQIQFTPDELRMVSRSMVTFVDQLASAVVDVLN
jgi:hypothetical protein